MITKKAVEWMVKKPFREGDETESESESEQDERSVCTPNGSNSRFASGHNRCTRNVTCTSNSSESVVEMPRSEKPSPAMSVKNPIRSNVIKSESQYAVEERVCQEATIGGSGRLQRANTSDSCRDVDIEVEEKEVQRDEKSKAKASTPQEPIGSLANENGDNESAPASFDIVTNTDGDGWQTKVSEDERNIAIAMEDDDLATKSGTDTDSDTEWEHLVSAEDKDDYEVVSPGDISQAKFVMRNITSRIPLVEETAIRRSVKLVGPPLEFARTHSDEFAQKFRWPQHARNLRNTKYDCIVRFYDAVNKKLSTNVSFSQDPIEIMEDFELSTEDWQSGNDGSEPSPRLKQTEKGVRLESAFAQVPRPMVALAANALCTVSQKRKRSIFEKDGRAGSIFSASALLGVARTGERFGDHFVGSLLRLNGKALQGIDSEVGSTHDRRCWSSLPTKKKPIANWRFILERVESFMGGPEGIHDAVNPPIKPETLNRITNRLKSLYGCATQYEDNDIFERVRRRTCEGMHDSSHK